MRKALSVVSALVLIGLIVAILRMSPEPVAGPGTQTTTDTSVAETTDLSTVRTSAPPTTARRSTDSTRAPRDAQGDLEAAFTIAGAVFGDGGYVVITNVGTGRGTLAGFALCQRPSYFVLPDITLDPFDSVWVATGDGSDLTASSIVQVIASNGAFGGLRAAEGELALYSSAQFSVADELVSYVEWGETDHGRSSLAVEAGLWEAGAYVEIPSDAFGVVATAAPATGPDDWTGWVGG